MKVMAASGGEQALDILVAQPNLTSSLEKFLGFQQVTMHSDQRDMMANMKEIIDVVRGVLGVTVESLASAEEKNLIDTWTAGARCRIRPALAKVIDEPCFCVTVHTYLKDILPTLAPGGSAMSKLVLDQVRPKLEIVLANVRTFLPNDATELTDEIVQRCAASTEVVDTATLHSLRSQLLVIGGSTLANLRARCSATWSLLPVLCAALAWDNKNRTRASRRLTKQSAAMVAKLQGQLFLSAQILEQQCHGGHAVPDEHVPMRDLAAPLATLPLEGLLEQGRSLRLAVMAEWEKDLGETVKLVDGAIPPGWELAKDALHENKQAAFSLVLNPHYHLLKSAFPILESMLVASSDLQWDTGCAALPADLLLTARRVCANAGLTLTHSYAALMLLGHIPAMSSPALRKKSALALRRELAPHLPPKKKQSYFSAGLLKVLGKLEDGEEWPLLDFQKEKTDRAAAAAAPAAEAAAAAPPLPDAPAAEAEPSTSAAPSPVGGRGPAPVDSADGADGRGADLDRADLFGEDLAAAAVPLPLPDVDMAVAFAAQEAELFGNLRLETLPCAHSWG